MGHLKITNFQIIPNGKFIIFRCSKIWAHCRTIIMCLPIGTPKIHHFPFGTNGKVVVLGVPILKHFKVIFKGAIATSWKLKENCCHKIWLHYRRPVTLTERTKSWPNTGWSMLVGDNTLKVWVRLKTERSCGHKIWPDLYRAVTLAERSNHDPNKKWSPSMM